MRFGDEGGELVLLSCGTLSGLFDQDFQRRKPKWKPGHRLMHKEKNVERFTISTPAAFPRDFCPVCIPEKYSKNRQNKGSKPLLDQHGTKLDFFLS